MKTIKSILDNHKCLKLICGAGNENVSEIEKLAYIFSMAGFDMIDVCAKTEVVKAAKNGLRLAGKEQETVLCVSVGLQDDIHLSKAVINKQKCILCGNCLDVCPQDAIYTEDNKYIVNDKRCIGCSRCIDRCSIGAIIKDHKYKPPWTMLLPLLSEQIGCVEFHCSNADESVILDSLSKIKSIYNGQLSICINRLKLSDERLLSLLKKVSEETDNLIIQADGKSMTGGIDDYKSNLQAVAFAELIRSSNIPAFIILSGGTNSKTAEFSKLCNVKVDGVALGSYARKIVKKYTDCPDFFENESIRKQAITIAENLRNEILLYL